MIILAMDSLNSARIGRDRDLWKGNEKQGPQLLRSSVVLFFLSQSEKLGFDHPWSKVTAFKGVGFNIESVLKRI
jgi:hypothetical protein